MNRYIADPGTCDIFTDTAQPVDWEPTCETTPSGWKVVRLRLSLTSVQVSLYNDLGQLVNYTVVRE